MGRSSTKRMLKSLITTRITIMTMLKRPCHPGEILKLEFLEPLEMTAGELAKHIGVPCTHIERLIKENSPVTVDTALRLSRFFGSTPQFWLNIQINYDVANADIDVSYIQPL